MQTSTVTAVFLKPLPALFQMTRHQLGEKYLCCRAWTYTEWGDCFKTRGDGHSSQFNGHWDFKPRITKWSKTKIFPSSALANQMLVKKLDRCKVRLLGKSGQDLFWVSASHTVEVLHKIRVFLLCSKGTFYSCEYFLSIDGLNDVQHSPGGLGETVISSMGLPGWPSCNVFHSG